MELQVCAREPILGRPDGAKQGRIWPRTGQPIQGGTSELSPAIHRWEKPSKCSTDFGVVGAMEIHRQSSGLFESNLGVSHCSPLAFLYGAKLGLDRSLGCCMSRHWMPKEEQHNHNPYLASSFQFCCQVRDTKVRNASAFDGKGRSDSACHNGGG